jgi:hypothetical protein
VNTTGRTGRLLQEALALAGGGAGVVQLMGHGGGWVCRAMECGTGSGTGWGIEKVTRTGTKS